MSNFSSIPYRTRDTIDGFILHGRPTGGFVAAVLANDLFGAVARADPENRMELVNIVRYVLTHCPPESLGSYDAVDGWIKRKGSGNSDDQPTGEW